MAFALRAENKSRYQKTHSKRIEQNDDRKVHVAWGPQANCCFPNGGKRRESRATPGKVHAVVERNHELSNFCFTLRPFSKKFPGRGRASRAPEAAVCHLAAAGLGNVLQAILAHVPCTSYTWLSDSDFVRPSFKAKIK